jgi:hypothetical protein
MNYPRRQQYRRLSKAGEAAVGSVVAAMLAFAAVSAGAPALAGPLLLTAVGLGLYSRHWLSLARRSRVGARSEDAVQRALAALQAEGWRLRHSLAWRGGVGEISTRWRSPRPVLRWRSRPRRGPTTLAISLWCASRQRGCHGAADGGPPTARSASCALCGRGALSVLSTTFS